MLRFLFVLFSGLLVFNHATNTIPVDVIELNDANFNDVVMPDDKWLVAFTAPWCQFCQKMKPDWSATASTLRGT